MHALLYHSSSFSSKGACFLHAFCMLFASCFLTHISTPDGTTTGRNDNECGHIGHISIDGVLGWTTDAPAASA